MKINYSIQPADKERTVKSIGRDMNVSFKDMVMIADNIRGMALPKAISFMEEVIAKSRPVRYTRFQTGIGHRKGSQVKIGKYPVKAAAYTISVLKNLEANAEFKGLEASKVKLFHVQALHGVSRARRKPKGRWATWNTEYVHLQVVGREA
ncbi:MAG: 50S ribosomal protein L22 [Candidatus Altiarchaeota archaeon]